MSVINEDFDLRDTGCSHSKDTSQLPRHRWYVLKEAFSPALVNKALNVNNCNENSVILDPFCGSGTVPLTVASQGASAFGVEVNPFMQFVGHTKRLTCEKSTLIKHRDSVINGIKKGRRSPLEGFSTFTEKKGAEKWLFNLDVLRGFEGGWSNTSSHASAAREITRLGLISSAMQVCNAFHDGKCLRYSSDWSERDYNRNDFLDTFEENISQYINDMEAVPIERRKVSILPGDSRSVLSKHNLNFNLCITSPPYLNSFDYSDIYRPELFLGKFVRDNEELIRIRKKTMRSHIQTKWADPTEKEFGGIYADCYARLAQNKGKLWNPRLLTMVQAYFEDWKVLFKHLLDNAADGAGLWIVVSTSAYAGVEIPVDLILADIGVKEGWSLEEVGVLRYLRSSGQHFNRVKGQKVSSKLRESVVILRK